MLLLDRMLYTRIVEHGLNVISSTSPQDQPFPYVLFTGIFPDDVYERLLASYPSSEHFVKANQKHHSNEYGGSTRQRMTLCESSLGSWPIRIISSGRPSARQSAAQ